MSFATDLLLRWAHIVPATILVGGAVYARFALAPSTDPLADEQKELLKAGVRARWMKWVMICAFLLLVSGIINVVLIATQYSFPQKYYHPVVGVKMLVALVVFYIASMLTGRSENAARFREKERFWLSMNAGLAISIVLMGGALKVAERIPKGDAETVQPAETEPTSPSAAENGS